SIVRIWAKDIFAEKVYTDVSESKVCYNLLSVGRLTEKKGYETCLKAISLLKEERSDFHYTIIGEGALASSLKDLCKALNVSDLVTFLGALNRESVKNFMEKCDVLLLHSVTSSNGDMEGTPTVILEAGLLGKPVVSTFHAGIPEIIAHGKSGYLTQEHDAEKTTFYLNELMGNPQRRSSFGRELKDTIVEGYSEGKNFKRLTCIYESLGSRD
ncbi:glycosyltransferase, partial [Candidatus Omnitrophota bacterium]